jgi:hypothetical protein
MATSMGINKTMFAFMSLMTATTILLHAQDKKIIDTKNMLLSDIAAKIVEYKNKTVTLRLKLKYADRIFEKISFYDRKNNDIEFDISSKETKKLIVQDMLNLHEGMGYLVTFTIRNIGKNSEVVADLLSFTPAVLDSLP